ncbi:MAG: hypothetical protein HY228_01305 [Candidatus Yonathbacteria bacterium]|nr:hypothetical protein [Candidatus Yonathbacteria bacterium]
MRVRIVICSPVKKYRLKSAQVRKVDEHTLLVSVVERKPFALWCGDEFLPTSTLASCWFIDDTGFIFDRAPVFSPGVYFEIYGKRENEEQEAILRSLLPPERFSLALAFIQELQRDQIIPLRLFMKPEGEYGIVVNSSENYPVLRGVELLFKDEQNASTLLKNLSFAIPAQFPLGSTTKKKLHYIDLRFGNKVFFGFEK